MDPSPPGSLARALADGPYSAEDLNFMDPSIHLFTP
jgi:hypothetical protein